MCFVFCLGCDCCQGIGAILNNGSRISTVTCIFLLGPFKKLFQNTIYVLVPFNLPFYCVKLWNCSEIEVQNCKNSFSYTVQCLIFLRC